LLKKKKKFNLNKNLFEEGTIDSFEVIDFISFLEKEFKIKFKSTEFQNHKFMIIKNLIISIFNKLNVRL
jgi:acyl carrier protein